MVVCGWGVDENGQTRGLKCGEIDGPDQNCITSGRDSRDHNWCFNPIWGSGEHRVQACQVY